MWRDRLFTLTFTSPPLWRGLIFAKLLILLARRKGFEPLTPRFEVLSGPFRGPLMALAFFRVQTINP